MKAIVFDLDGTLIDSAPDLHQAANKLLADLHDKPLDLATIRSFIGNGVPKLVERLLAARNRTQDIAFQAEMTENFLGHYNAALFDKTRLYPAVITCLEVLKGMDIKLGICTNKPEQPTLAILSGLNLDRFFTSVIGGDSLTVKNPLPNHFFMPSTRLVSMQTCSIQTVFMSGTVKWIRQLQKRQIFRLHCSLKATEKPPLKTWHVRGRSNILMNC